jgi:hypothetical protein
MNRWWCCLCLSHDNCNRLPWNSCNVVIVMVFLGDSSAKAVRLENTQIQMLNTAISKCNVLQWILTLCVWNKKIQTSNSTTITLNDKTIICCWGMLCVPLIALIQTNSSKESKTDINLCCCPIHQKTSLCVEFRVGIPAFWEAMYQH